MATRETLRRKLFSTIGRHNESWLSCDSRFLKDYPSFIHRRYNVVRAELFPLKFGVFVWSQITSIPVLVGKVLEDYGPKQYARLNKAVSLLKKRANWGPENHIELCLSDVMPFNVVSALEQRGVLDIFVSNNVVFYSDKARQYIEDLEQVETSRENIRVIRV